MAVRPVFMTSEYAPYYKKIDVDFTYNGGFAKVQKQKNIMAIHEAFKRRFQDKLPLEISSKSMQEGGEALSAFFLKKYVPSINKSIPVENVFQAGKVFEKGGPYTDLLEVTPREAKRDERLRSSGRLIRFQFEGKEFPLEPKTIFYDYVYINALLENKELAEAALHYDAFTDVEFNPEKSLNCQARSAAIFVSLYRQGLIDKVKDFEEFQKLFSQDIKGSRQKVVPKKEENKKPEKNLVVFKKGDKIQHPKWGMGIVEEVAKDQIKIRFDSAGVKELGAAWVQSKCSKIE